MRHQPNRQSVFVWLYVVARHEAYRLVGIERRYVSLQDVAGDLESAALIRDGASLEMRLEALEALRMLANLPETQRRDLALLIAGFTHREIAEITGGRACTNVNKQLAKARARLREYQLAQARADASSPRSS